MSRRPTSTCEELHSEMDCELQTIATQVCEIQALQAIFCGDEEFCLNTPDLFFQLENFLATDSKETAHSTKQLKFTLNLKPSGCNKLIKLYVCLPERYPDEPPLLSVTSNSCDVDRLVEEDLNKFARDLLGNAMIMQLAMHVQEISGKYLSVETEQIVDINKSGTESDIRCCLLCIDHMRSKVRYIKTLMSWMKELDINGFLIFYGRLIVMLVEGVSECVKDYLIRHRTVNVDVDSSGRPCKERMMKCLWDRLVDTRR